MNAKALIKENIQDAILGLDEDDMIEPTDSQLRQVVVPNDKLEMAWCGGSKRRGCGNKFNLFHTKFINGFIVCPFCGKLN